MNGRLAIATLLFAGLLVVAAILAGPRSRTFKPSASPPAGMSEVLPLTELKEVPRAASAVHDDGHPFLEVVDEKLAPVEDAIACMDLGLPALGRSGSDGLIIWTADALPFDSTGLIDFLVHQDPVYAPVMVRLGRSTRRFRVILKRGSELTVEVTDSQRRPIPKAEVRLLRSQVKDPDAAFTLGVQPTDSEGRALFRGLAAGPLFVTARASGFGSKYLGTFVSHPQQALQIVLTKTDHEVRVVVQGPDGGPFPGADVELRTLARSESDARAVPILTAFCGHVFTQRGTTDREGRISFDVLKGRTGSPIGGGAGDFDLLVSSGEYKVRRWQMTMSQGDVTDVIIAIPHRAVLHVTIDRRGSRSPLEIRMDNPFRDVETGHWLAPELNLGPDISQFSFEVPAHRAGLVLRLAQQGRPVLKEILAEFQAGETRRMMLSLPETHRLHVAVTGKSGLPIAGGINVVLEGPCPCHGEEPGYCGAVMYRSVKLSKSGEAELYVQEGTYRVRFIGAQRVLVQESVRVSGDTSVTLVSDDLAPLRGRIADVAGRPAPGVMLIWCDHNRKNGFVTVSGAAGEFQIDDLMPSTGSLFYIGPRGGAAVAYEGPLPAKEVAVLYTTMRLRGIVRGGSHTTVHIRCFEPDTSFGAIWGYATNQTRMQADADGLFEVDLLPGKWAVEGWIGEDGYWHRGVNVTTASGEMQIAAP
jgi:hypothetical protein